MTKQSMLRPTNYIGRNTLARRSFAQTERLYIETLIAHGAKVKFDSDLDDYVMFIEIDGKHHEASYHDIDSMYYLSDIDVCKAAVTDLERIKSKKNENPNPYDYY